MSLRPTPTLAMLALLGAWALSSASAAAQSAAPASDPANELDIFMEKVLKRRELNRQILQQYILDDIETFELLGPGRVPIHRAKRDFTWYVRDGVHVRSPIRFDGVAVGDADRRKYEENWLARERRRLERKKNREKDRPADEPSEEQALPIGESGAIPIATPRFVSEAYFMDFKFEPGNYYLAGREQIEGKDVLRIEYYPQQMFSDDDRKDDDRPDRDERKRQRDPNSREARTERDIERKMNKTSLVTLWVDPAEHQIVKYTFDNVWMDFLPGEWLVRVDDIRASMTMGQPFPDVWLPRQLMVHAAATLALGSFEGTYARAFANYKLADVKSKIRIPKGVDGNDEIEGIDGIDVDGRGPFVDELPQVHAGEIIREIRIHGNAHLTDDDVVKLAGISVGQPLEADGVGAIERRLKDSGRFETVDVRKRYRSLTTASDVAIVLVVHERSGVTSIASSVNPVSRRFGQLGDRLMFFPILGYADGYGFTYGGRLSAIDLLGLGERLSLPLTWGGARRAALEFERTFKTGPLTRVDSSIAIWNRENPRFEIRDQRVEWKARAERHVARYVRTGVETSASSVDFGTLDDRLWTVGTDAVLDTRGDPKFPRNAFLAGAGITRLHVRSRDAAIIRYTTDLRGYWGVIGQAVVAGRVRYVAADAPLPLYERFLAGGSSTIRGFRTGAFDGDRRLITSAELRVPLTSVLSGARLGVTGFFDAAKIYDHDTKLEDAAWHRGAGAGLFLVTPVVTLNLDIARGWKNGDTRVHLSSGFSF